MSDPYRQWAGAYVLGALDADERMDFEAHLASCEDCRRDVVEFSPLPGLLAVVQEHEVRAMPPDLTDRVVAEVHRHEAVLHRSRNRWRAAAMATTAAAVALIALVVFADDADNPAPQRPDGVELALGSDFDATGFITVADRPWGSVVVIDLFGVPDRDRYSMWAVAGDGTWEEIASWNWSEEGTCGVPGSTHLAPADIARVVITGADDRSDELAWGTPG